MGVSKTLLKRVGRNVRDVMLVCGAGPRMDEPDRKILEKNIFPYLIAREDIQNILDVGCHWYTWHYQTVLKSKNYRTIEIDPARKRYGAKHHIVDSVEHIEAYFEPNTLDLVMLNGVIGWGLNHEETADRVVERIRRCLRPGGLLMIGWDDVPEYRPFDVEAMPSLGGFEPFIMPPLDSARYRCTESGLRHTMNFYRALKSVSA